jgi:hypothetical protein
MSVEAGRIERLSPTHLKAATIGLSRAKKVKKCITERIEKVFQRQTPSSHSNCAKNERLMGQAKE